MDSLSLNLKTFMLFSKLKIKRMLMFKANLISQTIGMILNNLAFLLIWRLLFQRFGSINGYSMKEIVLIEGFVAIFYAFFYLLFGGVMKLSEYLNQDRILDLQLYPVNPLTILTTKSGAPSQFGDFLQGVAMIIIYLTINPSSWLWVIIGLILTIVGIYGVSLFFNSLIFFFPQTLTAFSEVIDTIYVGGSMYPSQNFTGTFRYLLYLTLLIPVVSFPIEVIRGIFSPTFLLYTLTAVILINLLGYAVWKAGIKRVESGSTGGIIE
jgi:ABC-2 type transport system permease protein